MPIKAIDVKGFLGEEKKGCMDMNCDCVIAYNLARQEIADKKLGLLKDKIKVILNQTAIPLNMNGKLRWGLSDEDCNILAKAIIENEHKIIVVKE